MDGYLQTLKKKYQKNCQWIDNMTTPSKIESLALESEYWNKKLEIFLFLRTNTMYMNSCTRINIFHHILKTLYCVIDKQTVANTTCSIYGIYFD